MPPKIPDRWIPYKAFGNVIEGTRIICFKVPLKTSVQTGNKQINEIWDINALLTKIPNLGAVVDLTNTSRYYNPNELQRAGILHKKILMPGRIIPPESKVREFMNTIDEFLGQNCDFLIGVHCTHGLNRTGYMVCRYMRDRLGVPAKDAIKRFERARGYQIERENYVADLLHKPPYLSPTSSDNTFIQPIPNNNFMPSYRSPLSEYGEGGSGYYVQRTLYGTNGKYSHGNKKNWRHRSPYDNSCYFRSHERRSYDYKYDY